jgi:hypothetical protein
VLLGIKVTDYTFRDSIARGNRQQKKVIAQQVEKIYPQAVIQTTDVVPDIYRKAAFKDGWVKLATNLKPGERVRLIGKQKEGIHEVLEINKDGFRTDFAADGAEVFVYGREVKDFRAVDYDAISMLNVSATQELARMLDAKDAQIVKLKQENEAMKQRLTELEAKDKARDARLAQIEKLLEGGQPKTVRVVAEKE